MASRQVNPPSPPRGPPGGIGDGDDGDRSRNRSKGGDKGGSRPGSKNRKRDTSAGSKGGDGFQKQAKGGRAPKSEQERARLDILAAERRLAEAKARFEDKNKDQGCLQCGKTGHRRYYCPDNPRNPHGNCWDGGKKEAERRRREAAGGKGNNGNKGNKGNKGDRRGSSGMGKGSSSTVASSFGKGKGSSTSTAAGSSGMGAGSSKHKTAADVVKDTLAAAAAITKENMVSLGHTSTKRRGSATGVTPPPKRVASGAGAGGGVFKIPKIQGSSAGASGGGGNNNNNNRNKDKYLYVDDQAVTTYDLIVLFKSDHPIPPRDGDDPDDIQTKLELDLALTAMSIVGNGGKLPKNMGWRRRVYGTSKPHLTYRLVTDKDRKAMEVLFESLILSKGGVYDRITLKYPEDLVVKTKAATCLVQVPHCEKLDGDYWRNIVEYAFAEDGIETSRDEWELADYRKAPSGYIVAINITDKLDAQLAEIDYTVTIGFQGMVKLNLSKRSKNSKGAEERRDETAKLLREQAKIQARLAQLQEEEDKAAGADLDMVTAALEGGRGTPTEDGAAVAVAVAMEEDGAGVESAGSSAPVGAATASAASTAALTGETATEETGASTGDPANNSWAEEMEAEEAAAATGQDGGTAQ